MSVHDEGYSKNVSCALTLRSTFLLQVVIHKQCYSIISSFNV